MAAIPDSPQLGAAGSSSGDAAGTSTGPAVVAGIGRAGASSEAEPSAAEPVRRSRWLVWLLAIALTAALLWGASQGRHAELLTVEVSRLEAELAVVGADLQAHRAHLERIRTEVDGLSARMLALRDLSHLDPAAALAPVDGAAQATERTAGATDAVDEAESAAAEDGAAQSSDEPAVRRRSVDF